jgi:indolepyruvate decarboxylase
MGREEVTRYVESSDCVVMLGVFMTDINLGIYTAQLDPARCISATSEKLSIGYHSYDDVRLEDFVRALLSAGLRQRPLVRLPRPDPISMATPLRKERKITVARLFQRLNAYLSPNTIVIADVGDALFGAADLFIYQSTEFLSPAYYTSMGFGVPAAIGAQLANPDLRPLVIVGDGGFQMTGMELSTAVRFGLNPVVVVLNNAGYTTERFLHEGPYNDILRWSYSRLPEVLGAGRGFVVETEHDLDEALDATAQYTDSFCLLDVHLEPLDASPALRRLTERLGKRL